MNKAKKPYVKPEITIIPRASPLYQALFRPLERESRGQRFNFTHPPPFSINKKS